MEYHILADAVVLEDEGMAECHPKLENTFRYVLNYRTHLISNKFFENKDTLNKQTFELAKKHFPDWIGLDWIGLDWIGLDWIKLDAHIMLNYLIE